MPAPTSPKKKSLMPSTPLRRKLRGAGHALTPVVQIGKEGATEAVGRQLGEALGAHELVKVKIGSECPQSRFEVAEILGAGPGVQVAQILGRTVLVYKLDPKSSRYEGKPGKEAGSEPGKNPGKELGKRPGKKSGKRAGKKSGKRAGKRSGKRAGNRAGKRAGKKSGPA
jgi:RNA-binding protein